MQSSPLPFDPLSTVTGALSQGLGALSPQAGPSGVRDSGSYTGDHSIINIKPIGLNIGELIDAATNSPPNSGGLLLPTSWMASKKAFSTSNISAKTSEKSSPNFLIPLLIAGGASILLVKFI